MFLKFTADLISHISLRIFELFLNSKTAKVCYISPHLTFSILQKLKNQTQFLKEETQLKEKKLLICLVNGRLSFFSANCVKN